MIQIPSPKANALKSARVSMLVATGSSLVDRELARDIQPEGHASIPLRCVPSLRQNTTHPRPTHPLHLTSYPPHYRAHPITTMQAAGRGNPRAWGAAKEDREPGRSRVIQRDARNPASCTRTARPPTLPLSTPLAKGMTAHTDSKYGLGERVGGGFPKVPQQQVILV